MRQTDASRTTTECLEVRLFGCWEVRAPGGAVEMGGREQRLVALLALHGRKPRSQIAGTLWPDTTEGRALTSLRSAVLRIRRAVGDLLEIGRTTLAVAPGVAVDVHDLLRWTTDGVTEAHGDPLHRVAVLRDAELLPGWYEDWVLLERERLLHVRLNALEELARGALARGAYDLAFTAAHEAVALEPLRESAHTIAIRAQLSGGNQSGALREYQAYRATLRQSLAISPSPELDDLLRPLLVPPPRKVV